MGWVRMDTTAIGLDTRPQLGYSPPMRHSKRVKQHVQSVYNYLLLARGIARPTHEHRKAALALMQAPVDDRPQRNDKRG